MYIYIYTPNNMVSGSWYFKLRSLTATQTQVCAARSLAAAFSAHRQAEVGTDQAHRGTKQENPGSYIYIYNIHIYIYMGVSTNMALCFGVLIAGNSHMGVSE